MRRASTKSIALPWLLWGISSCQPHPPPEHTPSDVPPRFELRGPGGARYFYLEPGTAVELSADLRSEAGIAPPAERVTFRSRDARIASVDSLGVLTARTEGTVWIVAEVPVGRSLALDSVQAAVVCTTELRLTYSTRDTTIAVGEAFRPSLELFTCGGHVRIPEALTWRARDPRVIEVDSITGRTVGRAPGETWLDVSGTRYRSLEGIRVVVRPR